MMNHLTDEQLAEWLQGEDSPQTQSHLAGCAQCRAEALELRDGIARYSIAMCRQADNAQKACRAENFAPQKALARHRLRWAAATVLTLLLAAPTAWIWMKMPHRPLVDLQPIATAHSNPPPAAMSDDELIEAVNNDLSREVPQALAPVSAITVARNRIAAASAVAATPANSSGK
jgi:hypothetical protein